MKFNKGSLIDRVLWITIINKDKIKNNVAGIVSISSGALVSYFLVDAGYVVTAVLAGMLTTMILTWVLRAALE